MFPSRRSVAVAMLSATVLITGCTTLDPYTREEKTSSATKGAAAGAAAGAVIGAISGGDRLKRAAIGAGVGALAGGSVGYYMDRQEMELRRKLEGTGVSVTRNGDNITLNMPSNVTFATDSARVKPEFRDVLESVALVAEEYEKTVIQVVGHTDSTGSDAYNQRLSEQRADAVGNFLTGQGIRSVRLEPRGMGESMPIADNSTPEGRARNRRVEVNLLPITK